MNPRTMNSMKKQPTTQLTLLLHSQQISAWYAVPGLSAKVLKIKGEDRLTVRDEPALDDALADLAKRLHDDGIHPTHALWVVDAEGWPWCAGEMAATTWLLPWEWLAQRFGLGTASPWEASEILEDQLLPWLATGDDAIQRQKMQQAREHEHSSETERLAAERAALALENEQLRVQNEALQQVDAELLVSFLPALYPRVFTVIGPADLALLCGRVEPVQLPNPYPEPVEETLRALQKRFRALPPTRQKQIVGFIAALPHSPKLQPRPEMRELVEELTGA